MADKAYACSGSCQSAFTKCTRCPHSECTMAGEPLHEVTVAYCCPDGHCPTSTIPSSHKKTCRLSNSGGLVAKAVVPCKLQLPTLDPPESCRIYSSINEGVESSCMSSTSGWSSPTRHEYSWVIIDAGSTTDFIGGVSFALSKNGPVSIRQQLVTRVAIDFANDHGFWKPIFDSPKDTNLTPLNVDCSSAVMFPEPVRAQFVRIRLVQWKCPFSLRCALILSGKASNTLVSSERKDLCRYVVDHHQLPAIVPLNKLQKDSTKNPLGIFQMPTKVCDSVAWKISWNVRKFNYTKNCSGERVFAVQKGSKCIIEVSYKTVWKDEDIRPDALAQLYYGIKSTFSKSLIAKVGVCNRSCISKSSFVAPRTPGLYYIRQESRLFYAGITLNVPESSFAAIRVLPTDFLESNFEVLPKFLKEQIRALLLFWISPKTVFFGLPRENLYLIFSYMVGLYEAEYDLITEC